MSKQSIVQINLKANEEIIKRTKQKPRRSFYMLGKESWVNVAETGKKAEWQHEGIDFIDEIAIMTPNEIQIIKLIKDKIKWDNGRNTFMYIVTIVPDSGIFNSDSSHYIMEYSTFLKGFRILFKKNFLRRISKNKYMFNPEFFIVTGEQTMYFELAWTEAKQYKKKDT